jgi:O-antigen/teichoic acid export membrane protein
MMNWHSSRWLVGSAIVLWMSGNLFTVAAGALLGVTAVGALKASQSLIGVSNILFLALDNVVPIRAAQHYSAEGAAGLLHYLARVTRIGLAAIAAICLCFAVYPAFWLRLVYGVEFVQYGFLLRWYSALYVLTFLTLPLRSGLRAIERTASIFVAYAIAALFSMVAAYPLVGKLGLVGVLVGLLSIQALLLGTMLVPFRRTLFARSA